MASGDKKPSGESDDPSPAPNKPDVRVSSHEDMGVHVSRDLRATGNSARGHNSNMSKLSFSSRGLSRDEGTDDEPTPPKPVASAPVQPPAAASSTAEPATPEPSTALSWLTGLFSRR
jgi:hypothetical protein